MPPIRSSAPSFAPSWPPVSPRNPSVAGFVLTSAIIEGEVTLGPVGEGTWPTMRATLSAIGLDEEEFLAACDGSFKQGSRFDGWVNGDEDDSYYHPFTPPPDGTP